MERRLAPDEAVEELNQRLRWVMRNTVGLFRLVADGRVDAKGAGVLVIIGTERFIFTARHVVAGIIGTSNPAVACLFPLNPNSEAVMGLAVPAERIDISAARIAWGSEGLDAAALTLPALENIPVDRFIDGTRHAEVTREKLKKNWTDLTSDDGYVPFLVCGFPNLGDMADFSTRSHLLSSVSFIAEVSSWDEWHWEPGGARCPQCHLDLSAIDDAPTVPGLNKWDLHVEEAARTATSEVENEAFGGISGGPVFWVAGDGSFLSGIVKEGGRMHGVPRVIASSWDDVYHAFLDSRNS